MVEHLKVLISRAPKGPYGRAPKGPVFSINVVLADALTSFFR